VAVGAALAAKLTASHCGMKLEQLRGMKRAVGIADGKQKLRVIRGALRGRLINVLITDRFTAQDLLKNTEAGDVLPLTWHVFRSLVKRPFRARSWFPTFCGYVRFIRKRL
jgi:Putative sugar-binding domain